MKNSYLSLFKYKNFILIAFGNFISGIGSKLTTIALPIYAYHLTKDPSSVGIMFAAETIPWVIIGPYAGVWVDKLNRKKVLIFSEFISAILIGLIAVASHIYQIYLIYFLLGVVNTSCTSARGAILPMLVPKEKFKLGLSFYNILMIIVGLTIPAVGGVFLLIFGAQQLFLMDAISFILSGLLIFITYIPKISADANKTTAKTAFSEMLNGFKQLFHSKMLNYPLIFELIGTLVEALAFPLLVVLIVNNFSYSQDYYGYLITSMALGSLIGTFIAGKWLKNESNFFLIFLFSIIVFSAYYLVTFNISFIFLFIVFMFGHVGDGLRSTLIHTLFGLYTMDKSRGCAIGCINSAISLIYIIGYLASGPLSKLIGIRNVFHLSALLGVGLCLIIFVRICLTEYIKKENKVCRLQN